LIAFHQDRGREALRSDSSNFKVEKSFDCISSRSR